MILPLNPARKGEQLSDEEFYDFCQQNPHLRIERDEDGQIIFEMPPRTKTSIKNLDIAIEVGLWNRQHKLGYVTDSNGGFTLPDSSVRVPDVAWVSRERWDALSESDRDKFAKICPYFVIELMSDPDERYTLPAKMEKYLRNGVRLAWVIDPFEQQTTVYQPGQEPQTVPFDQPLAGGDVLPGFALTLRTLLA